MHKIIKESDDFFFLFAPRIAFQFCCIYTITIKTYSILFYKETERLYLEAARQSGAYPETEVDFLDSLEGFKFFVPGLQVLQEAISGQTLGEC